MAIHLQRILLKEILYQCVGAAGGGLPDCANYTQDLGGCLKAIVMVRLLKVADDGG